MINFKKILLAAGFIGATMLSGEAMAASAWNSAGKVGDAAANSGVNVSVATLVSASGNLTLETAPLPVNCDAVVSVYIKASATTNDSATVLVGPTTATSMTAFGPITATTTASRTILPASGQCYVWGKLTPATGSTGTTTISVQQENTLRRARPGGM